MTSAMVLEGGYLQPACFRHYVCAIPSSLGRC